VSDEPFVVAVLRQWRKHICKPDGTFVIWGHVYDDFLNRFPDGHFIHTARVEKIEGNLVYTVNNVYRLEGEAVGPEYNCTVAA
jgi:hypothetical protein